MSVEKYTSIFPHQMEAIVYTVCHTNNEYNIIALAGEFKYLAIYYNYFYLPISSGDGIKQK